MTSTTLSRPLRPALGRTSFLLANVLMAVVFGVGTVVSVLGVNLVFMLVWLGLMVFVASQERRRDRPGHARLIVWSQSAVMVVVIVSAALAPDKTTERYLRQSITLPATSLTLGELAGDAAGQRPEWLPRLVCVDAPDEELSQPIVFDRSTLSLGEFVATIESQSTLKHRFMHCGNGWTILWGGDCSFGLRLRRPRD